MDFLNAYADSDAEDESKNNGDENAGLKRGISLVESYGDEHNEEHQDQIMEEGTEDVVAVPTDSSVIENKEEQMLAERENRTDSKYTTTMETTTVEDMGPLQTALDDFLPPRESEEQCNPTLREKLNKYHQLKAAGRSVNQNLYQTKAFHNPDILEKLISFCDIVEIDSNYPKELFDPFNYNVSDFYDNLEKEFETKLQEQAKSRTQIEFKKEEPSKEESKGSTKGAPSKWDVTEPAEEKKVEIISKDKSTASNAYAAFVQEKKRQLEEQNSGKSDKKRKQS